MPDNKIKATVLTLVLASMIISGCSNGGVTSQTTAQTAAARNASDTTQMTDGNSEKEAARKYLDALKDAFHNYAEANYALSDDLEAEKFGDARNDLDNMENALDELVNIDAPEKYSANHSRLRGSLSSEYDYIRLCRKFLDFCEKGDSLTKDDEVEVKALSEEIALTTSDFSEEFLALVKTVKADIDE